MENNAAKIVSSAILGEDYKTVLVNGKIYVIKPPTIHKIAGAGLHLSNLNIAKDVSGFMDSLKDIGSVAYALSWLVDGSDDLYKEFSECTLEEVVSALSEAISLISAENFCKLSVLAKNVQKLIANQKS